MKSRFTDQQIAFALQQAEAGTPVAEVCRKMGVSEPESEPSARIRPGSWTWTTPARRWRIAGSSITK